MIKILTLYFDANKQDKITVYTLEKDLQDTQLLSDIQIFYKGKTTSLWLTWNSFNYAILNTLKSKLNLGIKNELQLHPSIKNSLGYYQSQYYKKRNRKGLTYAFTQEGKKYWIGNNYLLFSSSGQDIPASWLYNDHQGNIVLEITPIYPWLFNILKPGEIFIKYSQWMKSYKPDLVKTISKETAQQWISQLDALIKVVEENDKRLRCTGFGCVHCAKIGKTGCHCGSLL